MSNNRQRHETDAKPPARTGQEVAQFSMSPVARFSMSLDKPGGDRPCGPRRALLVDPGRSVEAPVLAEHRLDLNGEVGVLGRPLSRSLLPLPPGVVAAAGHPQLPAQPGHRVAISEFIDQAKPLGGSCSFAKCAAASLKKSFSLLSSRTLASSMSTTLLAWRWVLQCCPTTRQASSSEAR
jgi:hypothetical protein